ncbi:MAG TPA: chlorophyllase, partial [Pilimelia sp.]|nr:chlorophyllase [Pilimelia sp.]
ATGATAPDASGAAPAAPRCPAAAPAGTPAKPVRVVPAAGTAPEEVFAVGVRTLSVRRGAKRPLPTTVWYPATGTPREEAVEDLPAARGPFPLVLFSHGLETRPDVYAEILVRWVQAGFIVAAPAYPHTATGVPDFNAADVLNQPADATEVITRVLALNTRQGDPLRGRIETGCVAAAGHSAGGITTVGLLTSNRDDRLDAAIVLAGRKLLAAPFTGPPAPVLFVHGTDDRSVPYADALAAFKSVPWSRAMLTVTDGGHSTTGEDFEVTVGTAIDFLRWSLYGDAAAKARIPGQAAEGGIATLTDHL